MSSEKKSKRNYIKIMLGTGKMKDELKNIADNLDTTVSALLKPEIRKFIDSFPKDYRLPPPTDL